MTSTVWKERIRARISVLSNDEWDALMMHYRALLATPQYHLNGPITDPNTLIVLKHIERVNVLMNDVINSCINASFVRGAAATTLLSSIASGVRLKFQQLPKSTINAVCCFSECTTNVVQCRVINSANIMGPPYLVNAIFIDILNAYLVITHYQQYVESAVAAANSDIVKLRKVIETSIEIIYWSLFI